MKALKFLSGLTAVATAATMLTAAVSAYDFGDKNLGKNWSLNAQVPAGEFADLTVDSYVTVTFEADQAEEEYWSFKPLDSTWTFIDPNGEGGPELSEGKDAYPVQKEDTSITFKVPADFVDSIKEGGMIIIGHSITLKTLTVSNDAPATEAAPAETEPAPAETQAPTDTEAASEAPAETQAAAPTAGDTNTGAAADKSNADTGVEGVAIFAAVALIAGTAVIISRKRK